MFNVYMDDVRPGPFYNGQQEYGYPPDPADWADWVTVRSIANVKRFLEMGLVNKLSLDHDMGSDATGYDLVLWMAEHGHWPKGQIWVHSANPVGRDKMMGTIERYHPTNLKPIMGNPYD